MGVCGVVEERAEREGKGKSKVSPHRASPSRYVSMGKGFKWMIDGVGRVEVGQGPVHFAHFPRSLSMDRGARSSDAKLFRCEDVANHCTPEDAWIIVNGEVYDVSGWNSHPGGVVIFSHAGRDATHVFHSFHPKSAQDQLPGRHVGSIRDAHRVEDVVLSKESREAMENDFKAMESSFRAAGMFQANPLYYLYKSITTVSLGGVGWVLTALFPGKWWAVLVSMVLFGFFFQQSGWLCHDFVHHQVFPEWRWAGDAFGYVFGNVFQGFSVDWWKNKHNVHHAVPNCHESAPDRHDGDPDVETLPVLSWSNYFAAQVGTKGGWWERWLLRHQAVIFWPALLLARFGWMDQSVRWVGGWELGWGLVPRRTKLPNPGYEAGGLVMHYVLLLLMYSTCGYSVTQGAVHFVGANMIAGVTLAIAFVVGHNGREMLDIEQRPSFIEMQLRTSRNVHDDPLGLTSWFMGGLEHQIEHHLFPTMPRHMLPQAKPLVKEFCTKHHLPYHCTTMYEGLVIVANTLHRVATDFVRDFPAM